MNITLVGLGELINITLVVQALLLIAGIAFVWKVLAPTTPHWDQEKRGDLPCDIQAAEAQAKMLLRQILTGDEDKQLRTHGYLEVRSPSLPQRVYRVPRHQGLVKVYEKGRLIMYLCAQPVKFLPTADVVLMHKLHIEADEERYLRLANRWYPSPTGLPILPMPTDRPRI